MVVNTPTNAEETRDAINKLQQHNFTPIKEVLFLLNMYQEAVEKGLHRDDLIYSNGIVDNTRNAFRFSSLYIDNFHHENKRNFAGKLLDKIRGNKPPNIHIKNTYHQRYEEYIELEKKHLYKTNENIEEYTEVFGDTYPYHKRVVLRLKELHYTWGDLLYLIGRKVQLIADTSSCDCDTPYSDPTCGGTIKYGTINIGGQHIGMNNEILPDRDLSEFRVSDPKVVKGRVLELCKDEGCPNAGFDHVFDATNCTTKEQAIKIGRYNLGLDLAEGKDTTIEVKLDTKQGTLSYDLYENGKYIWTLPKEEYEKVIHATGGEITDEIEVKLDIPKLTPFKEDEICGTCDAVGNCPVCNSDEDKRSIPCKENKHKFCMMTQCDCNCHTKED